MPRVDSFYFGNIVIDGKKHQTDVIVSSDGVQEKESSHEFTKSDFQNILMREPEVIIIGIGTAGAVKVDPEIDSIANDENIEVIKLETPKAVDEYNKLYRKKKVIAMFHLTC